MQPLQMSMKFHLLGPVFKSGAEGQLVPACCGSSQPPDQTGGLGKTFTGREHLTVTGAKHENMVTNYSHKAVLQVFGLRFNASTWHH